MGRVFEDKGYSVYRTRSSKDGGRDLQVVRKDGIGTAMIYVECKRYAKVRPVGVGIVRQLYGVINDEDIPQGLIVTTSHFTQGARLLATKHRYRLSLTDYTDFRRWLSEAGY